MGGIVKRACWAARFGGLVVAMAVAGALPVPVASAATSPGWAASTAPVSGLSPSAGTAYENDAVLADVACPAVGSCVAVGNYQDSQGYVHGLVEVQSGSAWQAATAPLTGLDPAPAADPEARLTSLACPEAGICVAIGLYSDAAGGDDGLIETLSGGVWTAETAPLPAGSSAVTLESISCPSASWCVSVGSYRSTSGGGGVIETLSNGTWTASSLPDSGLSLLPNTAPLLRSVSCSSVSSCVAVGSFVDPQNYTVPLLATLNAGTWSSAQATLGQLNPQAGSSADLTEVSCASDGSCAAAGSYLDTFNHQDAMLASLSQGSWSVLTAPATGLSPARGTAAGDVMDVNWAQCPAAGSCVAVGDYVDVNGTRDGLAEVLSNGSWSARTLPVTGLTPAASYVQSMTRISCVTSAWCVAIGTYYDVNGFEHGLLETLSNGAWTATAAPISGLNPAPEYITYTQYAVPENPNAIACESTGYCVSAGYYESASDNLRGLIETFSNAPVTAPGYWVATTSGTVYAYNAAAYPQASVTGTVTGIAADGPGYLMATSAGQITGVNAPVLGSMAGKTLPAPVVGIAADAATGGYWLVTSAGNVYNFGAPWYGSMAGMKLPAPVVAIAAVGSGYALVTKTGNVYNFHTPWYGSPAASRLSVTVSGMTAAG